MKKAFVSIGLMSSLLVLAGCNGGTTYGTGTSHEVATMKSLGNIFSLKNDKQAIDYKTRPDLVMPASRNALPQPVDNRALATDQNWPQSPELRSAQLRANAPLADNRNKGGGDLPVEYLTDTDKSGIGNSADLSKRASLAKKSRQNSRSGADVFIQDIKDEANGEGSSVEARKRRDQLAFSTGVKRKFLTEPPVEYRTPSANAEAGDLGITIEDVTERQKRLKKERIDSSNGVLTPQGAN